MFLALAFLAPACGKGDKAQNAGIGQTPDAAAGTTSATAPRSPATTRSPVTTAAPRDPCVVVAQDDAAELAGTPVAKGVPTGSGETRSCLYTGDPSGPTAQVEIYIGPGAKKILDIDRELGHELDVVPGVGDEAHIEDFAIFFRVGRDWFAIRLVRLDDFDAYRQPMIDLAARVAKAA